MESTAQYWKLVWQELEGACELFLARHTPVGASRSQAGFCRCRALAETARGPKPNSLSRPTSAMTTILHP
jgi:hypothetical protein